MELRHLSIRRRGHSALTRGLACSSLGSTNRSARWSGVGRSIVRLNGVLLFGRSTAVNFEVLRRTVRRGY
jgi:hypothetical protein